MTRSSPCLLGLHALQPLSPDTPSSWGLTIDCSCCPDRSDPMSSRHCLLDTLPTSESYFPSPPQVAPQVILTLSCFICFIMLNSILFSHSTPNLYISSPRSLRRGLYYHIHGIPGIHNSAWQIQGTHILIESLSKGLGTVLNEWELLLLNFIEQLP